MITPDLILSEAVIYDLYKVFLSLLPSLPPPLLSRCLFLSLSLSLVQDLYAQLKVRQRKEHKLQPQ